VVNNRERGGKQGKGVLRGLQKITNRLGELSTNGGEGGRRILNWYTERYKKIPLMSPRESGCTTQYVRGRGPCTPGGFGPRRKFPLRQDRRSQFKTLTEKGKLAKLMRVYRRTLVKSGA